MRALLAAVCCAAAPAVWACTPELSVTAGGKARMIEAEKYILAFRTQPENIVIGQHFIVEFALCAKGAAAAPDSVRVDAHMPEHRHGMNYKTSVTATGAGQYRARGLLFHMPGRWEYIFEVRAAGVTERLTTSVVLQ
jgi:YtkA-like